LAAETPNWQHGATLQVSFLHALSLSRCYATGLGSLAAISKQTYGKQILFSKQLFITIHLASCHA